MPADPCLDCALGECVCSRSRPHSGQTFPVTPRKSYKHSAHRQGSRSRHALTRFEDWAHRTSKSVVTIATEISRWNPGEMSGRVEKAPSAMLTPIEGRSAVRDARRRSPPSRTGIVVIDHSAPQMAPNVVGMTNNSAASFTGHAIATPAAPAPAHTVPAPIPKRIRAGMEGGALYTGICATDNLRESVSTSPGCQRVRGHTERALPPARSRSGLVVQATRSPAPSCPPRASGCSSASSRRPRVRR